MLTDKACVSIPSRKLCLRPPGISGNVCVRQSIHSSCRYVDIRTSVILKKLHQPSIPKCKALRHVLTTNVHKECISGIHCETLFNISLRYSYELRKTHKKRKIIISSETSKSCNTETHSHAEKDGHDADNEPYLDMSDSNICNPCGKGHTQISMRKLSSFARTTSPVILRVIYKYTSYVGTWEGCNRIRGMPLRAGTHSISTRSHRSW